MQITGIDIMDCWIDDANAKVLLRHCTSGIACWNAAVNSMNIVAMDFEI